MKRICLFLPLVISLLTNAQINLTRFEKSGGNETPTYYEVIDWWKKLDQQNPQVKMQPMGMTDANEPLHLVIISQDRDFNFESLRRKNKRIILINNGIHPGEPDGIDASMLLARDILNRKLKLPANVVLAIIPVYNIGGALNRSADYRVDQNGPEEFGFRGNAQNLDLNRDFIKCDSRNAKAFTEIFRLTDPDVFVDNHVSNGADYQHVMTLIASQHNKLGGPMGKFMNEMFEPGMYVLMKKKGYDLIPYVNAFGDTPETGWSEFLDGPRYSSGYASLWHSFAFVPETHMLKPYKQRVEATYALMQSFIEFTSEYSDRIRVLRNEQRQLVKSQIQFPVTWTLDRSVWKQLLYRGYTSERKPSGVSGLPRLFYDRSRPFDKQIPFYNVYKPASFVEKPDAYIVPQSWWKVVDLLKLNKVQMVPLKKDTVIQVEVYRIEKYQASTRPYESHHPNSEVQVSSSTQNIKFRKGDYLIPMNQSANRFLIEVLEPQMPDSYFSWNFFDGILQQKEGYSAYAFEDIAADYLAKNPALRQKLDERKATDSSFAKSGSAQLNFVYQNSPWFEPAHMRYPVFRVVGR